MKLLRYGTLAVVVALAVLSHAQSTDKKDARHPFCQGDFDWSVAPGVDGRARR
jgi:hypothetical protein